MCAGEGDALIGADGAGQTEVREGALEDGKGIGLLRGRERVAREEIAGGEVRDRQRVAVAPIGQPELAFVVRAPEVIGLARCERAVPVARCRRRFRRVPPCSTASRFRELRSAALPPFRPRLLRAVSVGNCRWRGQGPVPRAAKAPQQRDWPQELRDRGSSPRQIDCGTKDVIS